MVFFLAWWMHEGNSGRFDESTTPGGEERLASLLFAKSRRVPKGVRVEGSVLHWMVSIPIYTREPPGSFKVHVLELYSRHIESLSLGLPPKFIYLTDFPGEHQRPSMASEYKAVWGSAMLSWGSPCMLRESTKTLEVLTVLLCDTLNFCWIIVSVSRKRSFQAPNFHRVVLTIFFQWASPYVTGIDFTNRQAA